MLKYLSKIAMDILPSVVATIIGAYIVNHYIVTKPAADAPVAAAVSPAEPKKVDAAVDRCRQHSCGRRAGQGHLRKGDLRETAAVKPAAEKPVEKPQEKSAEKSTEKPVEKSSEPSEGKAAETASIPVETRPHTAAPREKEKPAIRDRCPDRVGRRRAKSGIGG